ncbi:SDR family oxidoreductase [Companilactobacillus pabuli]|jgi:NADP-dependent 3-hydroxy acid dehydrogenase YdfG|uniref:SDR family oxidoreductase n=1 Tax=Companilactobacillus pabuli TaxID=2714036 RepID=A0A7L7KXM0_9LACO|nr:SDR family oxidoreductase [Companilactobacillus pabuli]AKP03907.1 oxidoreductase [Companilactobacillus farciminis]AKS52212.1 oxidoreductase [Companilactobacillus farciminis]MDG5113148.1 SDR family oxidoreductase [Companilactobacillus pabuli]QMT84036.1 SDR family oxidoreductase [Companilactobacillus pabuli]GAQ00234.1 oxidoreductase [Companilactobacillus farciminis]
MNKEKVVIITGASSGIGAATTRELAKQHAKLVIGARRLDRLNELKAEFPDEDIITQKVDVTNFDEVQALIDTAKKEFGRVDVLYNNAGVMPVNALENRARDEWQRILDVNVMGVLNGIAAVLPTMIEQKSGHIIATDSVAGHVVVPNLAVYNGSKFAVRAIMEGLRQEQHNNNIRTTIVSPGSVATELYKSIGNADNQKAEIEVEKQIGLSAENIAKSVVFAINAPENMDLNEMIIRPIKQDI